MGKRKRGDWEPDDDLQTHTGQDISRKADFFAEPPDEIGDVVSAHTTLNVDKEPMSTPIRLLISMAGAALGILIGAFIVVIGQFFNPFVIFLFVVGLGAAGGAILYLCLGFSHTCTFVGKEGVVKFTCSGSRDNVKEELFCFRDAIELRTSQTRHYTNGIYQGTDYSFVWTDIGGRTRFTLSGKHHSEQGSPPDKDLYNFAEAAEVAWSLYLLDDVDRQLMTKGEIRFRLDKGNWVSVGKGYLRLRLGGKEIDRDTEEIESVSIRQGTFTVKEVGGKEGWFSSRGVFKFDYSTLGNARLFLFVLDKVAGLPIE